MSTKETTQQMTTDQKNELLRDTLLEIYASLHAENWHKKQDFRGQMYRKAEETLNETRPCE